MAPAQIDTTKPFPSPRRTNSESTATSSMSSPASPTSGALPSASATDSSSSFLSRIRRSRSRSPPRRHTTSGVTSPLASPASIASAITKRPSVEPHRAESSASMPAATTTASPSQNTMPPRPRTQKRNSGTTMQCGRHSNDWLFGGFSITDTVRDLLHRADEENK